MNGSRTKHGLWLVIALAVVLVLPLAASATTPRNDDTPEGPDVATVSTPATAPDLDVPVARLARGADVSCSSGAHTLSNFGDRVYPEMGNGGYTSAHSDVYINYDAIANMFLPGTHVDLQVKATQCLSDLSFDFETTNNSTAGGTGPNFTVGSVAVNGTPAGFAFKQPTYPGDPNGQDDPDPAAHAASVNNPVGGTPNNPNPPACAPQSNSAAQNGTQCPASKLVVTPAVPIPDGSTVTVTINWTGRPGVHVDADNSTEGWFRINTAGQEGSFVTTEPVGTDSWMPLNNHPLAKPTYDIYDTTNIGKTAVGPGELVGYTPPVGAAYVATPPPASNAPDANFPAGSVTWHWHSPEGIANYLVENSIGQYDLSARTSPTTGIQYFEAQANSITVAKKATNKTAMDNQEDIVEFQKNFNGPWPLTTDGILVGTPSASFEEEMQGKITFAGGSIGPALGTFNHENMHQWFGDNVAEAAFNLTFWKEGFATLGEYLNTARGTPPGITSGPAFETSLVNRFNGTGNYNSTSLWTSTPSNPRSDTLFNTANTYTRPGTSYVALWFALGRNNMIAAMKDIQSTYGGKNITEAQLEQVFRSHLPVQSASCNTRLTSFFTQWWDTAFPTGGGLNRPQLTGPGLNGPGFPCAQVTPAAPNGPNGWYKAPVSLVWSGFPTPPATSTATKTGCVDETVSADGRYSKSCSVTITTTATGLVTGNSGAVAETFNIDTTAPVTTATLTPGIHNGWYASPTLTLSVNDGTGSGDTVDPCPAGATCGNTTVISIDGGPFNPYTTPLTGFSTGNHTAQFRSTDFAGNVETTKLLAFKADSGLPTVNIITPDPGQFIPLDKLVAARFKCAEPQPSAKESGIPLVGGCVGSTANAANLDTSTIGDHTITVTATDVAGNVTVVTNHYEVIYTWQGFFSVSNEDDTTLNLVHAGDLIKVGFGLNGDRGLGVLAAGSPISVAVACPAWTTRTIPAGGVGTTAGLSYGVASGHYTYGWQTQAGWAGTCRQFRLQTNDGTAPHTAVFMFFA